MTDTFPTPAPPSSSTARLDFLRLSSPVVSQFVLLVAAVLTAGLFAGNWLHNATPAGDVWQERARDCWSTDAAGTIDQQVEHQQRFEACMASAERQRAAYALGGMAVAGLAAAAALCVVPVVIAGHRRLRPLAPQLAPTADRARRIAHGLGLSEPPGLVVGTSKMRDAFSYGLPHRYRLALPPRLAVSFGRPAVLDPVLAHELAHVSRHDVTYAWLARTVWYAVVPVLGVPFVVSAIQGDVTLAADFLWRAMLLLGAVRLVTARLLRVREHEADLTAARYLGVDAVQAGLRALPASGERHGTRAALALHPTPPQRVAVMIEPAHLATPGSSDGLSAGFLAGVATPLLLATSMTALTGTGALQLAHLATAVVAGGALGAFVGSGLWRAVLVDRVAPGSTSRWGLVIGVGAGLVLGGLVSLGQTATAGVSEPVVTWWLLALPLVGAGATTLVGGLGELWADTAPGRADPPRVVAPLAGAAVLAPAMLLMLVLRPVFERGLVVDVLALASTPLAGLVAAAVIGLAAVAALWLRAGAAAGSEAPRWLLEHGTATWARSASPGLGRAVVLGLLGGATGAAAVVGFRVVVGPPPEALVMARVASYLLVAAVVGAVVMLVLSAALPNVGPGAGLVAAPVAGLVVTAAVLVLNLTLGGSLVGGVVGQWTRAALGVGLLVSLAAAAVGVLPRRRAVRPSALGLLTVVLSLVGSAVVLQAAPVASSAAEVPAYQQGIAARLEAQGSQLMTSFMSITGDMGSSGPASAERFRTELLPLVDDMQARAASAQLQDASLRDAHALIVESLDRAESGLTKMADGLDSWSTAQYEQGADQWNEANQLWAQWRAAVTSLAPPEDDPPQ